jgi:hypothetical protein
MRTEERIPSEPEPRTRLEISQFAATRACPKVIS